MRSKKNYCKDSEDIFRISFLHFFYGVFALGVYAVEGKFSPGKHLDEWCYRLQRFNKTATVSARFHLKTTVALGYLAWQLYKLNQRYVEWIYMAYKTDLAAEKIEKLKRYIESIPKYFNGYRDLTSAKTILHYEKDGMEFKCKPEGILNFKRGQHPDGLICDDILKDPQKRLDLYQLEKIERIFFEEIESMPKYELHVFGTPQDRNDLFAKLETRPGYNCKRYPAILNHEKKIVLWPEEWPWERLMQKKADIREKAFNKEFLCRPVRAEEGFFKEEELDRVICPRLKNYDLSNPPKLNDYCFAGFDIGKKSHPSHLAVFGVDRQGRLVQVHSKWMDGWRYTDQVEYLKLAIEKFKIAKLYYDATRAEFEGFDESGELAAEMEGVIFNLRTKSEMAVEFERMVSDENILLLPDERQKRQILNVDNEYKSLETEEGHGDSFWSICMAIRAYQDGQARLIWEL